jgi:hypothetical protein
LPLRYKSTEQTIEEAKKRSAEHFWAGCGAAIDSRQAAAEACRKRESDGKTVALHKEKNFDFSGVVKAI